MCLRVKVVTVYKLSNEPARQRLTGRDGYWVGLTCKSVKPDLFRLEIGLDSKLAELIKNLDQFAHQFVIGRRSLGLGSWSSLRAKCKKPKKEI